MGIFKGRGSLVSIGVSLEKLDEPDEEKTVGEHPVKIRVKERKITKFNVDRSLFFITYLKCKRSTILKSLKLNIDKNGMFNNKKNKQMSKYRKASQNESFQEHE